MVELNLTHESSITKQREAMRKAHATDVVDYYDEKTRSILAKYGPGPRVHFSAGYGNGRIDPVWTANDLSRVMVRGQEELVADVVSALRAAGPTADILDVGCGLGGAAIHFAQELGASVTAITIVAKHIPIIENFASQAGVSSRIDATIADVHTFAPPSAFDAVTSFNSSCYFDRVIWFRNAATSLRDHGSVHIVDVFLGRGTAGQREFDTYWHTQIGSVTEYEHAARAAGFRMVERVPLNDVSAGFWTFSLAWTRAVLRELAPDSPEANRLLRSITEHVRLENAFRDGTIEYSRLRFARD